MESNVPDIEKQILTLKKKFYIAYQMFLFNFVYSKRSYCEILDKLMDFENFYITWYSRVKHFAREYVLSDEEAENITQDVFLDFYQKRESLDFHINVIAYLFTSVKNRCIDYLRRKLLEQEAASKMQKDFDLSFRMKFDSLEAFDVDDLSEDNIKDLIEKALNALPERCREIFILSKLEGKKQKEIAEELNVSVKTIETQMTIAYKKLREELKNHIPLLLFILSLGEN